MVTVKSPAQLDAMRRAGAILRDTLDLLVESVQIGMSTHDIDMIAREFIKKQHAIPSFLNYDGFPGAVCTSIDEEVVHGIPSKHRIIQDGMLLKLDCGAGIDGVHSDAARTVCVGHVSEEKRRLAEVCKQSFFEGMKVLKDGTRLGNLGHAIQSYVEANGFSVVRDLVGHGIGTRVHEDPNVPNYGVEGRGLRMFKNMTIAVEPMINVGTYRVEMLDDGWTVVPADGKPSAHYENTVIITESGVEILTL